MNSNINKEKSFFRSIILSVLGKFQKELFIDVPEDNTYIPVFFSLTGDERYLQDKFLEWMTPDCQEDCKKAEGNYDPIPRGVLNFESSSIKSERLSNPNIRLERNIEKDGDISAYNTYVKWIPFNCAFKLEFLFDTSIEGFLIKEKLLEKFYKFVKIESYWKGLLIDSILQFPDDDDYEKTFDFSSDDVIKNKFSLNLELETYFPIFNKENEFFSGNNIQKLNITQGTPDITWSVEKDRKDLL